ncbi:craniofacial development protein 2-like [Sitophilus oryzae]|uniref:Craniofacial development protein 2-like n=1 Tax=Sitophilus oryzae TaxID=7048 RepID=A0A6J2YPS1_SITOR|nr:craniofacial development protein 2-like [Sitophilus oryzae]
MSGNLNNTALSPGQMFNHQRVLRIPRLDMRKTKLRFGTWNTRTLLAAGKLDNAVKEMLRLNVDILGISETRWTDSGVCVRNGTTFYYSGNSDPNHRNGVGFIVRNNIKKSVRNVVGFSGRIILLQMNASPTNINLIQIYAPTADKQDEEAEELYGQIQEVLRSLKPHEITIILGDFNAKVGKGRVADVVGAFGLGERNGRGELLLHFCKENMVIKNTFYKLHPRRLYTWKSPQDSYNNIVRNQIDYILINRRYQNSIKRVAAYPGADIGSDHNPLIADFQFRLKLISEKRTTTQRHYNIDRLREPAVPDRMKFELTELWASNNNNLPRPF